MSAISATTMGLAPATTLQGVLARGAVLGGTQPDSQLAPVIPGINAGVDGVAVQPASAPTTGAAAVTGGGAQAVQGAGALGENPQLIAALQAVANAIQQLVGVLQAQAGAAATSGSTAGGGDTVGQCGMAGCTMDHGSASADPALAASSTQPQAATVETVADADVGVAPAVDASGAPAPSSVAPASTA